MLYILDTDHISLLQQRDPYDEPATQAFESLRRRKVRIGTQDLRIAAIAISHGATVVTRNLRDFRQVPDLVVEDWSTAF